ncbi:MAG TPA: HNH endonuclease [bacterium]|nr:HNH endonuclease [bacterium]
MSPDPLDARVRAAAFAWLTQQVDRHGDVLPRRLLAEGFLFEGIRVPLVGPQGIFKPRILRDAPLSITTAPEGPYDDGYGPDGLLRYRYRGTVPLHPDNRGLRAAMVRALPLAYFKGIIPGKYIAIWPVFVVADDPANLTFSIAVDDPAILSGVLTSGSVREETSAARRLYITATVRRRLHQRTFRERVLDAYRRQCAFCRLRHEELLDAAHIIPDPEPAGEPVVPNGLALCSLHHAAFDRYFLGLRPDYTLEVRRDILEEDDGPVLVHALQRLHGTRIIVPREHALQPDPALVEARYQRFRDAMPR